MMVARWPRTPALSLPSLPIALAGPPPALSGGGLCYGYDVVKRTDSEGEPVRGERKINEAEAAIVRRIFREFAAGKSPRAIATGLNRDGLPGPFGRAWGDTTIRGHACRGNGIVNNELYAGVLVWNRQRFIKDPNSG